MATERQDEIIARNAAAARLQASVRLDDDGAEPDMFDYLIVYDDKSEAAMEVTSLHDGAWRRTDSAADKRNAHHDRVVDGLGGSWIVDYSSTTDLNELDNLVLRVAAAGLTVQRAYDADWATPFYAECRSLGVQCRVGRVANTFGRVTPSM